MVRCFHTTGRPCSGHWIGYWISSGSRKQNTEEACTLVDVDGVRENELAVGVETVREDWNPKRKRRCDVCRRDNRVSAVRRPTRTAHGQIRTGKSNAREPWNQGQGVKAAKRS